MSAELEAAVIAFLHSKWHYKSTKIALDASLNLDLGMDGEDAVDFFDAFAEKFNVDFDELGEEWDRYFLPEAVIFGGPDDGTLTLFTAPSREPSNTPILPLRIARLVNAAETGRWQKLPIGEIT